MHANEDVITAAIYITKRHSEELVVSCGNKHNFIGMQIELVKDENVNIDMQSYIKEAIKTFGGDVPRGVTSTATNRLFYVTEGADKYSEEKAATFPSTMEKMLWMIKRS